MIGERCTRPHQSGMEQKHEKWVLETLNFLQHQDIPFYKRDQFGNRISGGDMDIPERLMLVHKKIADLHKDMRRWLDDWVKESGAHRATKEKLTEADDMLETLWAMLEGGASESETEDITEQLTELLRKHRPKLFEEEENDNDDS